MKQIMNKNSYMKNDSIIIVSGWLTSNAIFTSTSILISYGIIESLLYGTMLTISVIICYLLLTFRKPKELNKYNFATFDRLLKIGFFVYFYMKVFIICVGGGIVLSIFLRLPFKLSAVIFLIIGIAYTLLKFQLRFRHYLKIFSITLFVTCWLVVIYIIDGVDVIYKGMRLYHPYLFYMNWKHLMFFSLAVSLIFMSKLLFDRMFVIHTAYQFLSFKSALLIGLTYSSFPISFAVLSFSTIYKGIFENTYTIFRDLFLTVDKMFFSFLFLILLFILVDTFELEANKVVRHNNVAEGTIYLLPLMLILMTVNEHKLDFANLFFVFGIWTVAFFPTLIVKLYKPYNYHYIYSLCSFLAASLGYGLKLYIEIIYVIPLTFILSISMSILLFVFYQYVVKHIKKEPM